MAERPKVVVTDFISEPLDIEREILGDTAEVIAADAKHEEELAGKVEEAAALMTFHSVTLQRPTIERLDRCKLIVRCGVGFDNVDGNAARERGIDLANVPDYGTEEVADTALAMTLSLTRGTHFLNSRLRRNLGVWSYQQVVPQYRQRGRIFAVVGLGRIGIATALRAKAFGFDVCYFDPYIPLGMDKALGIRQVESLEELASQAHVLNLSCPLTEQTRGLVTSELLRRMPRGGFLINTARGGLMSSQAVLGAIEEGQLAGAGLDVLPVEPPSPDDPLIQAWRNPEHPAHDRVLINPHSAFYCEEGLTEMRQKAARNCLRVLQGQTPVNVVN